MPVSHGRSSLVGTHHKGVHLEAAVPKLAVPELCPRLISCPILSRILLGLLRDSHQEANYSAMKESETCECFLKNFEKLASV
jgi:hypothetical protein